MSPLRVANAAYLRLLRRLPPRAAWVVWRSARGASRLARRRADPTEVAVARIAFGVDERALAQVLPALVERAGGEPSRVLVVSDCDAVHVVTATGCRFEFLPPQGDWERHMPQADHAAFAQRRVGCILAAYRVGYVER